MTPSTAKPAGTADDQAWMRGAGVQAEVRQVTDLRLNDGATYSGSVIFTNGSLVAHGSGACVWPGGRRQEGEWQFGRQHGLGLTVEPTGDSYRGQFRDGQRHGTGTVTMTNGVSLTGTFQADRAHGDFRGTEGPFEVEGRFEDGKRTGWWKRRGALGTDIEELLDGSVRKRARGVVVFEDGARQTGEWDFSARTGKGEIRWKDGRRYTGAWRAVDGEANDPEGEGEMTWSNGDRYVGSFVGGRREGRGRMRHVDGRVEEGVWKDDRLVKSQGAEGTPTRP